MIRLLDVKCDTQGVHTFVHINDVSDVQPYMEYAAKLLQDHVTKVIKSGTPPSRWDHMGGSNQGSSMFNQAVMKAQIQESNPIYLLDGIIAEKHINLINTIERFGHVLINKLGGFAHLVNGWTIEQELGEFNMQEHLIAYNVRPDTKYLNLENDPDLEGYVKEHLGNIDPNFSWVTGLRDVSKAKLGDIYRDFKENGGTSLFIYTTGSDVPQMRMYVELAIEKGIKDFVFHMNAGTEPEHRELFDYIEMKPCSLIVENIIKC